MPGNKKDICKKCKKTVQGKSICCSTCKIWYHFKYSNLTNEEFKKHEMNENLIWHCPKCTFYYCGKCCKIIKGRQENIFCYCCNNLIHYKSCGLDRNTFDQLGCSEDLWFGMDCIENNVPFGRLCKLFGNNSLKNRNKSVDTQGIPFCRVCARRNNHLSSALKCEHFIHKKCSKMSNNLNKIKNLFLQNVLQRIFLSHT